MNCRNRIIEGAILHRDSSLTNLDFKLLGNQSFPILAKEPILAYITDVTLRPPPKTSILSVQPARYVFGRTYTCYRPWEPHIVPSVCEGASLPTAHPHTRGVSADRLKVSLKCPKANCQHYTRCRSRPPKGVFSRLSIPAYIQMLLTLRGRT